MNNFAVKFSPAEGGADPEEIGKSKPEELKDLRIGLGPDLPCCNLKVRGISWKFNLFVIS